MNVNQLTNIDHTFILSNIKMRKRVKNVLSAVGDTLPTSVDVRRYEKKTRDR